MTSNSDLLGKLSFTFTAVHKNFKKHTFQVLYRANHVKRKQGLSKN